MSRKGKIVKRDEGKDDNLTIRERVLGWIANRLGGELITKTRSRKPEFVFQPEPIIRKPEFDYVSLFEVFTTSWPLVRTSRAIVQEATREDVDWTDNIVPRFKFKCVECGEQYQTTPKDAEGNEVDKCPFCEGKLRGPDIKQKQKFRKLIKEINSDYSFRSFVRSSILWDIALDDVYWSITFEEEPQMQKGRIIRKEGNGEVQYGRKPKHVYVEDSRFIFPVADEYGHLGGWQWYCDKCYGKGEFEGQDLPVVEILPNITEKQREALKICEHCGGPMTQTAYVQEVNGTVLARWGRDEIVHGSSSSVKPSLFGNPKIVSLWKIVQTILAMDDYNYEVYSEGKVGSIIAFPGEDQEEIDEKKRAIEEEIKRLDNEDITTGRYRSSKKIRNIFMGSKEEKPPIRIPIMEDLKKMQSIEYYDRYLDAVGEVYGVTPEFVSSSTPGEGSKLKIEVQDRTTKETHSNYLDPFNNDLLYRFNITDWILAFKEIEKRDELRDAQVTHTKVAAMLQAARIGLDATIDENGKVRITGKAELVEPEGEGSRMGQMPRQMGGKPRYFEEGEPARVTAERFELRKNVLPISWYSLTQIKLWDNVYAINNDKDEVYVSLNEKEIDGTRIKATNFNYAIANLLDKIMDYIGEKIGRKIEGYDRIKERMVIDTRRDYNASLLIELASILDRVNERELAEKIDSLRLKLDEVKPTKVQSNNVTEMIEPKKGLEGEVDVYDIQKAYARPPYIVEHEGESLKERLDKLTKWAVKEYKKRGSRKREQVINEAINKAKDILEEDLNKLVEISLRHANNRLKRRGLKETVKSLSPEEYTRLKGYAEDYLADYVTILRDTLKSKRRKRNA